MRAMMRISTSRKTVMPSDLWKLITVRLERQTLRQADHIKANGKHRDDAKRNQPVQHD